MNERSKPPTPAANKQSAAPEPKERVGDIIRHAREKRGISLETLATELKINSRYIEALEANDYDRLPGDTYIRVYLRSICVSCSLNPEVILQRFFDERGLTGVDTLRKDSSTKINLAVVQDKEKPGPVLYIVLALIAVLVVFSFFASKQGWFSTHATGAESKKNAKQTTLVDTTESVPVPAGSGKYASNGKASGPVSAVRPVPAGKGAPPRESVSDTMVHRKSVTPQPKDILSVAKKIADTIGKKPAEVKKPIKDTSLPKVAIPKPGKDTTVLTVKIPEPKPTTKDSGKPAIASKKPVDSLQKAASLKPPKDTGLQKPVVLKPVKDSTKKTTAPDLKVIGKDTLKTVAKQAVDTVRPKPAVDKHKKDSVKSAGTAVVDTMKKIAQPSPSVGKTMRLRIAVANDSCWARVYYDGNQWRRLLRKGRSMSWTARDSFNVHIGVNESVTITLDGNPITIPGIGVVTFKVDPAGNVTTWTTDKWNTVFQGRQ